MITIAGCGALGSLLAARLLAGGVRVQALQRAGANLDALRESGIVIEGDAGGDAISTWRLAHVSDDVDALEPSELIIVLVKSAETANVAMLRRLLTDGGAVLTLQNGLGNGEKLAAVFGENRVAVGTATYGANRLAPGVIAWGGDGHLNLGPFSPGTSMVWVAETLASAGLSVSYLDDPMPAIWTKLAVNLMINPVSAITGRRNGELAEIAPLMSLMRCLCQEALVAARQSGVTLELEAVWHANLESMRRTALNKSSMLQDIEAHRTTEIDAIAKPLLDLETDDAPLPYVRAVYLLIKAIEGR